MDQYMKATATAFVHHALKNTILKIMDCKQSCEVGSSPWLIARMFFKIFVKIPLAMTPVLSNRVVSRDMFSSILFDTELSTVMISYWASYFCPLSQSMLLKHLYITVFTEMFSNSAKSLKDGEEWWC